MQNDSKKKIKVKIAPFLAPINAQAAGCLMLRAKRLCSKLGSITMTIKKPGRTS